MALNALTLSVSNGIQGRPFKSAVSGMTAGNIVEVMLGGSSGFGYSNGLLINNGLPSDTNLVVLRERNTITGENLTTRLIVTAVGSSAIAQQAAGMSATARNVRVAGVVQNDGSVISTLFVEDATGATVSAAVGGTVAISISGTPSPATIGSAYSFTPTTANGSGTKTFAYSGTSLAGFGLSFSTSTGAITGTVSGSAGTITGTITVTDTTGTASLPISIAVGATITLGALTLSDTNFVVGSGKTVNVLGATGGSAIAISTAVTGFTINSGARTLTYDGTGSAATPSLGLTETLAGATNSGRVSSIGLSIAASGGTPFSLPAMYTTTSLFPYSLVDNGDGTFGSTFVASNFKDAGTALFISPSGNDTTGDGSSGNPWRSISKALTAGATLSIVTMAPGRYAPPATTDGAGKSMSFVAATLGTVYVGNLLTNADVSSWGTPSGGQQTIALTTSVVAGFVDTTKTDPTTTVIQASLDASSAANIPGFQSASQGAIYRPSLVSGTTPSVLGAFDSRDLTNTFDTTLLAWRASAPTTYFSGSAGGRLYFENLVFVGEDVLQPNLLVTTRIIVNNCNYIGADNCVDSGVGDVGICVFRNMIVVGVKGTHASDLIDYNGIGIFENVKTYNCSTGGADQGFTSHNGPQLHINNSWLAGTQGATGRQGRQGYFGCAISGTDQGLRAGAAAPYSIDCHVKGCTFPGSPTTGNVVMGSLANNAALYKYDGSLTGKTVVGGTPIDRSTGKPTTQQTILYLDPSQIGTLFQDTAGTTPVTADGQNVGRIVCGSGTGGYATVTSTAGTAVYHTDGTYSWITLASAQLTLNSATPFAEDTSIVIAINTTDSTFILSSIGTNFIDFRSSGINPYTNLGWRVTSSGGFAVNAGVPTSLSTIRTTVGNGSNNVFTVRRVDMMYTIWRTATFFCGGTPGANSLDGKIYGAKFVAYGTDAEIKTTEQAMAVKMGAVIP